MPTGFFHLENLLVFVESFELYGVLIATGAVAILFLMRIFDCLNCGIIMRFSDKSV